VELKGGGEEWFVSGVFVFARRATKRRPMARMRELLSKRVASQPLSQPNAGSVFRNPPNDHAARLIESCGLKGLTLGGAQVSKKHANFIVNIGGATARDIESLVNHVQGDGAQAHRRRVDPRSAHRGESRMSALGKVAVLMGGPSAEREISLISGNAVLAALRSKASTPTRSTRRARALRPQARGLQARLHRAPRPLRRGRHGAGRARDAAHPLHRQRRDGLGARHGQVAHQARLGRLGHPDAALRDGEAATDWDKVLERSGMPVIVKPAREGSTIGLTKVRSPADLAAAYALAAKYDELVIAEEFIAGQELTASDPRRRRRCRWCASRRRRATTTTRTSTSPTTRSTTAPPACAPTSRTRSARHAEELPRARLPRLGPRRRDAAPDGTYFVPRDEHLARHDRPQPGADRGARGGPRYPDLCVRILEMARLDSGRRA
jgi:hypothetical protein